jgi:membrane protein YdbS with pleckstrin-like domain
MIERVAGLIARIVRLPPPPVAPEGSGGSAKIFHPSRRFYRLRIARWAAGQIGAAIGIAVALTWMWIPYAEFGLKYVNLGPWSLVDMLSSRWFLALEIWGVTLFLLQIPVTAARVRLDYDQRWYLVTDRSLRIREGVRTIREQTMTFANIQNLVIRQNPIQRILGISDLHVRTAGGGDKAAEQGGSGGDEHQRQALHLAVFRGVNNAQEIRDLILECLKQIRTSGLGDPEERSLDTAESSASTPESPVPPRLSEAIDEVRRQTAALRRAVRAAGAE